MQVTQPINIETTIQELKFFREKLHNGIFGSRADHALTDAIILLRGLQQSELPHTDQISFFEGECDE